MLTNSSVYDKWIFETKKDENLVAESSLLKVSREGDKARLTGIEFQMGAILYEKQYLEGSSRGFDADWSL